MAPRALKPFGFCLWAARAGDLVGLDCLYVGRLKDIGAVWQLTAVDADPAGVLPPGGGPAMSSTPGGRWC